MKLRSVFASFALVVAAIVCATLYAQTPQAGGQGQMPGGPGGGFPGGPGGPGRGKAPQSDLEKHMQVVEDTLKEMRNDPITDLAKKDASIAKIAKIRDEFLAIDKLTPAYLAKQPEEKKAKFMDDFHAQIQKMLGNLDTLTAALKAGKAGEIAMDYKAVTDMEDPSHKEFQEPKQPRRGGFQGGGFPGGPGGPGMQQGGQGGQTGTPQNTGPRTN